MLYDSSGRSGQRRDLETYIAKGSDTLFVSTTKQSSTTEYTRVGDRLTNRIWQSTTVEGLGRAGLTSVP